MKGIRIALLSSLVLVLAGCSSLEWAPKDDRDWPSTETAEWSNKGGKKLSETGHTRIGTIWYRLQKGERYYSIPDALKAEILALAADQGGDWVTYEGSHDTSYEYQDSSTEHHFGYYADGYYGPQGSTRTEYTVFVPRTSVEWAVWRSVQR